ncbi:amidohydrolase family protein, partial [bacterium]|nr:amidohydrolase family protein [bacterium]
NPNSGDYKSLRDLGFTAMMAAPKDGIFCGQSAVFSLAEGPLDERMIREGIAQIWKWQRGGYQDYPNSQMGVIALIRQSLYDAQWYRDAQTAYKRNPDQPAPESNISLEALQALIDGGPAVVDAFTIHRFWQANKIAREFKLNTWTLGSGFEYRQLDHYKNAGSPLILPLNFPTKPHVETYEEALDMSLVAMRHWDWAPSNPTILHDASVEFCLTTTRLDKLGNFYKNLQKAIHRGLPKAVALEALTTRPAALLGIGHELGTLEKGKRAHLLVTNGCLFEKKTKRMETWIDGQRYVITQKPQVEPAGTWDISLPLSASMPESVTMELKGDAPKISGGITPVTTQIKFKWVELDRNRLSFTLAGETFDIDGMIQLSGIVKNDRITGYGTLPDGQPFRWEATKREQVEKKEKTDDKKEKDKKEWEPTGRLVYPPNPWGWEQPPEQVEEILVKNATIWTCGPKGILKNADMLIREGKIAQVGRNLSASEKALVIDAKGKHVTPGIMDCHHHTAIDNGVNEVGQEITAETRIEDVLYSYDIDTYRELAGGLTTAHTMHGSANPIGGQCLTYKLRWGSTPSEMIFDQAPINLKLALGENPKRVWSGKYPHSRMGVHEIIRDRFMAARDYKKAWEEFKSTTSPNLIPPRRDLELDALVAVLNGESRMFTHAYRQDEMVAHMRLAQELGIHPGNFQHGLECYKIADVMKETGAQMTTFSDWWMYKFEVYDAIPYNGALVHEQGVSVTFNSDNDALARRLNSDAGKAVKYGGMAEDDALKLVTLYTAQQLQVDEYVGSLEAGKHGDFVIWSGHPLSNMTLCEQTWIEGTQYFDREDDLALRETVKEERAELIQLILGGKKAKSEEDEEESKEAEEMEPDELEFWFPNWQDAQSEEDDGYDVVFSPQESN